MRQVFITTRRDFLWFVRCHQCYKLTLLIVKKKVTGEIGENRKYVAMVVVDDGCSGIGDWQSSAKTAED